MRIGQLAARSAVSVQTIRYYERRGLLNKPRRLSSGYRDYSPEGASIVAFIKRSQESGFTLKEIGTIHSQSDVAARLFGGKVAGTWNRCSATASARSASECGKQSNKRIASSL